MQKLDLDKPSALPTTGEFSLFNPISCQRAAEMYAAKEGQNLFGLMQLKAHLIDGGVNHKDGCPALEKVAVAEIDRLIETK